MNLDNKTVERLYETMLDQVRQWGSQPVQSQAGVIGLMQDLIDSPQSVPELKEAAKRTLLLLGSISMISMTMGKDALQCMGVSAHQITRPSPTGPKPS